MRLHRLSLAALFVGALSIAPARLLAQDVILGVKGGINIADLHVTGADLGDTSTRTGLVGGVFAELGLGSVFAIRPEGLYSQKGFSETDTGIDADLKVDYIEVPLLLAARFGQSSVRPVVFAGPVVGFEASCKLEGSSGGVSVSADCADQDVDTESTDFGVAFGGGVEVDAGGVVLLLDGRYTLGLRDIDAMNGSEAKNRVWSVMAGLGFHP